MSINHIALVSLTKQISLSELSLTAAALQKQVTIDLGPIWNIQATVSPFFDIQAPPDDYWLMTIVDEDKIDDADDEGYHWSKDTHSPFAIIKYDEFWQLTCSHELCEMLVDPYGLQTTAGDAIGDNEGRVNYLVEVCDPCQHHEFSYKIDGIPVSDFYTPNYFDSFQNNNVRYSCTGSITRPREILKNGYLTWQDFITNRWLQANFFGDDLQVNDVTDAMPVNGPLRSQIDRISKDPNKKRVAKEHKSKKAKKKHTLSKSLSAYKSDFIKELGSLIQL